MSNVTNIPEPVYVTNVPPEEYKRAGEAEFNDTLGSGRMGQAPPPESSFFLTPLRPPPAHSPEPILQFFCTSSTGPEADICKLAHSMVEGPNALPRNAERSTALRKLLEAKDAVLRALQFVLLVALSFGAAACDKGGTPDIPSAPDTALRAGVTVTVAPPPVGGVDCEILFVASAAGGKPAYSFLWQFLALPARTLQRSGSDEDAAVRFITTSSLVGTGTYLFSMTATDSKRDAATVNGSQSFNCVAGANTTSRQF